VHAARGREEHPKKRRLAQRREKSVKKKLSGAEVYLGEKKKAPVRLYKSSPQLI